MVIKTKTQNTNKTIVQQLTELMNQAFDYTVTKTLAQNRAMIELKEHSSIDDSFEKRGKRLSLCSSLLMIGETIVIMNTCVSMLT